MLLATAAANPTMMIVFIRGNLWWYLLPTGYRPQKKEKRE